MIDGTKLWCTGAQVADLFLVRVRQFDPALAFAAIERERVTMAHLAPVMVKMPAEDPRRAAHDLTSLRKVHCGSAPVLVDELRRAVAAFGPVFTQLYGMTEHIPSTMLLPHQQELDGTRRLSRDWPRRGSPTLATGSASSAPRTGAAAGRGR